MVNDAEGERQNRKKLGEKRGKGDKDREEREKKKQKQIREATSWNRKKSNKKETGYRERGRLRDLLLEQK